MLSSRSKFIISTLLVVLPASIFCASQTHKLLTSVRDSLQGEERSTSYLRELGAVEAALEILSRETEFVETIKKGGEFPLRHFSKEAFRSSLVRLEAILSAPTKAPRSDEAVQMFLSQAKQLATAPEAEDPLLATKLQTLRSNLGQLIEEGSEYIAVKSDAADITRREFMQVLALISLVLIGLASLVVYLIRERIRRWHEKASEVRAVHEEYFQSIFDSMNEGVLVSDLVGHVTYANARSRDMLAATSSQIVGEHIAALLSGRWEIESGVGRSRHEATLTSSEGKVREIIIERSNLLDGNKDLQGMLFILEDVTEKSALARALADYRDKLERGDRLSALGTLGAIVAHKLSQPISSVRLFLQQVKREVADLPISERARSNLDDSLKELNRISQLTKQMLKAGKGQLMPEGPSQDNASVLKAFNRVRESLSDQARRRGVVLSVGGISRDVSVRCSSVELEEMIYCLISNSLQAASDGSKARIELGVAISGNEAFITVSDTCQGIPAEHIDKLFEGFFTTKPEGQGTGLGLAIVRHIAERHGGHVRVSSEEGYGTCFVVTLPIVEEVLNGQPAEGVCC